MKKLMECFMDELKDLYSAEKQIVKNLPKLIKMASFPQLKDALSHHWEETKYQVTRLENIFKELKIRPSEEHCEGMEGILREADELLNGEAPSPVIDAIIIGCAQKVEHYEIASYGTMRSFAKYLDLSDDIIDLIQETLNEEGAADKKLTSIAEGGIFTSGVNEAAAETVSSPTQQRNKRNKM